jgi:predicted phage terminase large subunit-like protein
MYPFSWFKQIFFTVDPAGTVREGIIDQSIGGKKAESFTVISVWGVSQGNDLFWLDMIRFRDEIPEVVEKIAETYGKYKPRYVKIEKNGVGLGVAQYVAKLGIPVRKLQKGADKLENSTAAQLLMRAGKVWLPDNARWIDECEDELFSWTGAPTEQDDIIDTLSDAANEIGPSTEVLEEDTAKKLTQTIKLTSNSNAHSIGLAPNSAMSRITRIPKLFKGAPETIRREYT